jgi:hypothetical protein
MMRITITPSDIPTDEIAIASFEKLIGVPVPADYREFLVKHNGGTVLPDCFFVYGCSTGDYHTLQYLCGVRPNSGGNLVSEFETFHDRIPFEFIPIGYNPGSDLLLLAVRGKDYGRIFYWDSSDKKPSELPDDHEWTEQELSYSIYRNVHFVAGSFTEFLQNLQPYPNSEGDL